MLTYKTITFVLYFAADNMTAQGVTRCVRKLQPAISHKQVTATLREMERTYAVCRISEPHLPSRFYLSTQTRKRVSTEAWFNSKAWQARKMKLIRQTPITA